MTEQQALSAAAAEYEARMVSFCSRLIQTPSLPGQEGDAAALIQEEMRTLGYDDVWTDAVGNVIGAIRGSGGKSLMLNTHMDHVDAGDPSGWPFPPFEGRVHDGQVWGRGAMDIKGPTTAQVYGAALLRAAGLTPPGDVYVVGAVQEELGGLGSVELGRTLRVDRAVVGEASSNTIRRGHRGRIELIARVHGRSCHASMPDQGINPLYSLGELLTRLQDVETMEDPFLGRDTLVPTLVYTDQSSANVVPGQASLHIDWRMVPQHDVEQIRASLDRLLQASLRGGATGSVSLKQIHLRTYTGEERDIPAAFPSFVLEESDPLVQDAKRALEEAFGHPVEVKQWDFATDAGHLNAAGIPAIGFGPGDEALAHTNQERISTAELSEAMRGYAALALSLTDG